MGKLLLATLSRCYYAISVVVWILICLPIVPFVFAIGLFRHYVIWPARMAIYLRGNVRESWRRCLPLWQRQGSIDDYDPEGRGMVQRPYYNPSFATTLAREFSEKFCKKYGFIESRINSRTEAKYAQRMLSWMESDRERRIALRTTSESEHAD